MKRGASDLSLLVGVNKPTGMTSHDVVNRVRRIFGERRVGHTGTLDPLASGVLPLGVGPAARLDRYLTGHDKSYRAVVRFGAETDTDDCLGQVVRRGASLPDLQDGDFAERYIQGLVGVHQQLPPAYSAIKVGGKKAYELARQGHEASLQPREVRVVAAQLVDRNRNEDLGCCEWTVDFRVSKGTYIRSLARDIGRELGCFAHLAALERKSSGLIGLEVCHRLETLEDLGTAAALDPVRFLGMRYAYGDDVATQVQNGGKLSVGRITLYAVPSASASACACCASDAVMDDAPLAPDEPVAVILENRLKAVYRFDVDKGCLCPETVFSVPIARR